MAGLIDLYLDSRPANKRLVAPADAVRAAQDRSAFVQS